MVKKESILDKPKYGLDPDVWSAADGNYAPTGATRDKISKLVQSVLDRFSPEEMSVRIVGSITSNQYSEDSDVDVHFTFPGLTEENREEKNGELREWFSRYKDENPEDSKIGTHPIEVYFQPNVFQDLMSVGCYDFVGNRWVVGPELKDAGFDPYSEFYDEDMEYVRDIISDIRSIVLESYEMSMVIEGS
jgi:Nucleotidyltransferase domain.